MSMQLQSAYSTGKKMSSLGPWVVTGAAGFLGSHVVDVLRDCGKPVLAIDDFSAGRPEFLGHHTPGPDYTFARLDIRATKELTVLLHAHKPVALIHLAALHFIPACLADPARAVSLNVLGTQSVLTAARATGIERFWFASTGDVYAPAETPHREDDQLTPFNIYGVSKRMGEQLVELEARDRTEGRFFIGRLFNLYGPRETNPHILPEILRQLRRHTHTPLRLGNLWPRRDLVPVADAARAIVSSLNAAPRGVTIMNVASGTAWSMQQALDLIGELRGRPLVIETDPDKVRPVERAHLQADVSRLRKLLGWVPHSDLRRGLNDLLADEGLLTCEEGRHLQPCPVAD
jgi:UDP-glucose 4-epimerase